VLIRRARLGGNRCRPVVIVTARRWRAPDAERCRFLVAARRAGRVGVRRTDIGAPIQEDGQRGQGTHKPGRRRMSDYPPHHAILAENLTLYLGIRFILMMEA